MTILFDDRPAPRITRRERADGAEANRYRVTLELVFECLENGEFTKALRLCRATVRGE